jgi:hypothetical protein
MPENGVALDLEWSLLLAACSVELSAVPSAEKTNRIRSLLRGPIRWNVLFQLADRHGVEPALYLVLKNFSDAIPADEMRMLAQSYQTNLHKTLLLSRELIRILDCISAIGADVLAYKGIALAEVHYGDIALRQSGDIDLLIRPQDLPRIRNAVAELGYTPHEVFDPLLEREYLKSGYECAFDGTAGRNLLELQWAIQPRFYAIDFDMEGIFTRAVTVSVAGRSMRTPSPEDLVLVLSAHAAKHVWARLVWLCDIAQLMKLPLLNWNWIWAEARRLGIVRILRITLLAANQLLGAGIPAPCFSDDAASRLAVEIQVQIASETAYNVESLSYFRLMMNLREKPADRLRFLNRLVLNPGPGEWQAVRLPQLLFPLYRLVRLARLAARLARA